MDRTAGATVMVVDDTVVNLKLLEKMLAEEGYRVRAFPRGALALAAASRTPPDLVLLDIMMPEMDGFEVCRRMKSDGVLAGVPVIFMSALDDAADKSRAFAAGGVDYVGKPFQIQEVQVRVRNALTVRRVREMARGRWAAVVALVEMAECRDEGVGGHGRRTGACCRVLGRGLRRTGRAVRELDDDALEILADGAMVHDIGKGVLDGALWRKAGPLSPEETLCARRHTLEGDRILRGLFREGGDDPVLREGATVARWHHERWDGAGYPDGLKGEDIPLSARILAVAEAYEVLRSRRCYKTLRSHGESRSVIRDEAGRQFDPSVVGAFLAVEEEIQQAYDGSSQGEGA